VAGTVGNMLCDLFTLQSPLIGKRRAKALKALSVSFGLGLQMTNILKDVREDRDRNVSFIPQSLLAEEGLTQADYLGPQGRAGAARILDRLILKAKSHLEDALEYTCLLPRLEPRLRLFCLWPLFMAAETLALLGTNHQAYQEGTKLKISREDVSRIIRRTSVACWSNAWIRSMFRDTIAGLAAARPALAAGNRPAVAGGLP
jgi:farnesyl-diphosphate farnesyltransferase